MPIRQTTFPCGGQFTARFPSGGLGIPGTSGVVRIRLAVLSGRAVRLLADVIHNGENPGTGPGPLGLSNGAKLRWATHLDGRCSRDEGYPHAWNHTRSYAVLQSRSRHPGCTRAC
uniref:Uncharacterized protein n=1 Tax=Streptomyces avermitilis TaxID=33903 RepID=A0A499VPQ5_STRAX|nr:hypothetical protein SAVMC3_90430 [Streptomyces avermitilis]